MLSIIFSILFVIIGVTAVILTGMVLYKLLLLPYKKIQINIRDRGFISAVLVFFVLLFFRFSKDIGVGDNQYKVLLLVVFISCTIFLVYKLIKSIKTGNWSDWSDQAQVENPQEIEIKKYYQAIAPYLSLMFVAFFLLKLKVISETTMIAIVLPSLLAGLFVFRLRQKYSEKAIGFRQVITIPRENLWLFLQLCFSVVICLVFLIPLLIINI